MIVKIPYFHSATSLSCFLRRSEALCPEVLSPSLEAALDPAPGALFVEVLVVVVLDSSWDGGEKKPRAVTLTASTPAPPALLAVDFPMVIVPLPPPFKTVFSMLANERRLRDPVIVPIGESLVLERRDPGFDGGAGGPELPLVPDPIRRCLCRQAVGGDLAAA